jgi:hypothetical protein
VLRKLSIPLFADRASLAWVNLNRFRADRASEVCAEWLARHAEESKLAERWWKLESFLIREHKLFQLDDQTRAEFIEAAPLNLISDRLDELSSLNKKLICRVAKSRATTTQGLASKVLVALALVPSDQDKDLHMLLQSILCDVDPTAPTGGYVTAS